MKYKKRPRRKRAEGGRLALTIRQKQVYDVICDFYHAKGVSPTVLEVHKNLQSQAPISPTAVYHHINALIRKGWMRRISGPDGRRMARNLVPIPEEDLISKNSVLRCIDNHFSEQLEDEQVLKLKMTIRALPPRK